MDEATIFCGRFKLGVKVHRSPTCVVCLAEDVQNDRASVVVKFMKNADQCAREVGSETSTRPATRHHTARDHQPLPPTNPPTCSRFLPTGPPQPPPDESRLPSVRIWTAHTW